MILKYSPKVAADDVGRRPLCRSHAWGSAIVRARSPPPRAYEKRAANATRDCSGDTDRRRRLRYNMAYLRLRSARSPVQQGMSASARDAEQQAAGDCGAPSSAAPRSPWQCRKIPILYTHRGREAARSSREEGSTRCSRRWTERFDLWS